MAPRVSFVGPNASTRDFGRSRRPAARSVGAAEDQATRSGACRVGAPGAEKVGRAAAGDCAAVRGICLACHASGGWVGTLALRWLSGTFGWAGCMAGIGGALRGRRPG